MPLRWPPPGCLFPLLVDLRPFQAGRRRIGAEERGVVEIHCAAGVALAPGIVQGKEGVRQRSPSSSGNGGDILRPRQPIQVMEGAELPQGRRGGAGAAAGEGKPQLFPISLPFLNASILRSGGLRSSATPRVAGSSRLGKKFLFLITSQTKVIGWLVSASAFTVNINAISGDKSNKDRLKASPPL